MEGENSPISADWCLTRLKYHRLGQINQKWYSHMGLRATSHMIFWGPSFTTLAAGQFFCPWLKQSNNFSEVHSLLSIKRKKDNVCFLFLLWLFFFLSFCCNLFYCCSARKVWTLELLHLSRELRPK